MKSKKVKLRETESRRVVTRVWVVGEMGDIGPKIQTFNYKVSKFQRPNMYHDDYT